MPTQVTRNGKTYTEYSIQEIEAIRNKRLADDYQRRNYTPRHSSTFLTPASTTNGRKTPRSS